MKRNLIIVGASTYALVAYEIANDMNCFEKIDFVDDNKSIAPNGTKVIGTTNDICKFSDEYTDVIVAIGNPDVRLSLIDRIKNAACLSIATLISPRAYISPSAMIVEGTIVEPLAVVHALCTIKTGCIISAGAVINHESICEEGVHIDCNATVAGYMIVPARTKLASGEVYK